MVFSVYIYEMATNYSFHAITFPKYSDESTFFKSVLKIKEQKQEKKWRTFNETVKLQVYLTVDG